MVPTASRRSADVVKDAPNIKREEDDFQSPEVPERYVPLRIHKMLDFYQGRLPRYARRSARSALRDTASAPTTRPPPSLASLALPTTEAKFTRGFSSPDIPARHE